MGLQVQDWLRQLARTGFTGPLTWIGAGDGSALPGDLVGNRPVTLVEPNPAHHAALDALARRVHGITPYPVAIGPTTGLLPLRLYDPSALSSLSELSNPTALGMAPQTLRPLGSCPVRSVTLKGFVDETDPAPAPRANPLDPEGPPGDIRIWRVDAPGVETLVADAFPATFGARSLHLLLRCPAGDAYAGGRSADTLQDVLMSRGFSLIDRDDTDPGFTELWLSYDPTPQILRNEVLRARRAYRDLRGKLVAAQAMAGEEAGLRQLVERDLEDLRARYRTLYDRLQAMEPATEADPGVATAVPSDPGPS